MTFKKVLTPCLDCPDRYPACHDHCDRYKEWKEIHERKRAAAREQKQSEVEIVSYELDRFRRMKKNKG